ncbi:magnesium transporter [Methanomassiliicoccus luminyensis]|uniref:magnesium transporter n=1 Tax=Methanomassiliicoccus luminyensis TaxID=1080712 RepID=UPI00035E22DD|nr:magnesium transporter [Methanomassiliicoccus luminyensis]
MRGVRSFFARNRSVFSLGFVALLISSLGDLLAGATLGSMTHTLELLPGLMILIPPAIGMRGNIFGALGSRLGTAMHLGTFELTFKRGSILRQNMESSLLLTMIMSFLMGVLANTVAVAMGIPSVSISTFVFISVLGGVLAGFVLIIINVIVATIGFRRNWDIDNISAPLITAAGDIVTLPMLFLAAILVINFPGIVITAFSTLFLVITVALAILAVLRGKGEARRIFIHSSPVLVLCILLDIVAGVTIDTRLESLVALPALLVLIPPFLEDANALGGILTSRFGSMLHMGTLKPRRRPGKLALENFAIIYIFSLWVFVLVGISSYVAARLLGLGSPSLGEMVFLSLAAGLITVTALNFISYYVAVYTYKLSLDPDDHSIPLTSSAIDSVGAFALMGVIILMGLGV